MTEQKAEWSSGETLVTVPDQVKGGTNIRKDITWTLREDSGKVIARFVVSNWPDSYKENYFNLSVSHIYVAPEYRGKGIGNLLMEKVDEALEWDGGGYLLVHKGNKIAKSLYAKHGWEYDPTWECEEKVSPGMCAEYEWWNKYL